MLVDLPYRLVTVDIDGTLTDGHGWRYIADRLGRRAEYDATQALFAAGATDEDQHLRRLLTLARGVSRRQLAEILSSTPRVAGISAGVRELHRAGAKVALLTHNPWYVGTWYVREFHLDGFDGMAGSPRFRGGKVAPEVDGARADKPGGLARLIRRFRVRPGEVAHVGDGLADAAIFPRVGLGVAFGTFEEAVRRAADVVVPGKDFRAVVRALATHPPVRP